MRFLWAAAGVTLSIHLLRRAYARHGSVLAFAPWAFVKLIGEVAMGMFLLILAAAVALLGNG